MKKIYLLMIMIFALAGAGLGQPNAWINEFHYDNVGGDKDEYVEIVIENASSYNLSDFQVNLYNGNGGSSYKSVTLNNYTAGTTSGNYTFYKYNYTSDGGIQNGAPDGLALSYQGTLINGQFLSYEGSFTATDGPANGVTSVDIGKSETSSTPVGYSLQLSGTGTQYSDFIWSDPATNTFGNINTGQTLGSSSNDQTTEAKAPTTQISGTTISSLDDTQGEAVDVFKMTIEDQGDGDGLPTHVTNIRVQPYSTNTADWTNTIQGVTLNDGSAVTIGTPTITDTYIDIPITSGNLDVANGTSKDVTLAVYLNTSNIVDGSVLSFKVTAASHGFTADASGSGFISTFTNGDFNSSDFTITVTATQLTFSNVPSTVNINSDFSLSVSATDANGNTDTDDATSVTLSKKTGTGTLSSSTGLTQSLSSGTFSWSDLQYNTAEDFTIAANGGSYPEAVTGTITASEPEKLIISEVADPKDNPDARFVELYNAGSSNIDLSSGTWYLSRQANGDTWANIALTGTLNSGETYLISYGADNSNFNTAYGFNPENSNGGISGNGDDGYFLYKGGDHTTGTLVDAYGVIGVDGTGEAWEYTDSKAVRNSSVTQANTTWTASEWTIPNNANVADMTPGTHGDCITFNGSSTSTWGTAGNWVGSTAPTSSKNVKVPAGLTNNPSIDGDATTPSECNGLTIASGASLTIPAGKALTVHGNLTNNATAAGLVVESTSSGNGSLIVNGSISGNATVQRYIAAFSAAGAADGWHEIGVPVSSYSVSGTDWDPTSTGTNNDLYYYDESQNLWMNYRTSSFDFVKEKGYLAANDADLTHVFTGALNNSDVTVSSLSYTSGKGKGWHLLGNPFPCAIKWNDGNWTLTYVGSAEVWDNTTNPGNYTPLSANDIIPATNGFMVQVQSGHTGLVTIPTAARTHSSTNNYKSANKGVERNLLQLKITNDQNIYTDITKVGFRADATEKMDWAFDAHKLFGDATAPQLWTVSNGEMFTLNYLPLNFAKYDLPLHFKAGVDGSYTINFSGLDSFNDQSKIVLEDLLTGNTLEIKQNSVYQFAATTNDAENRFVLHFYDVTSTPEVQGQNNKALIYAYNHSIILKANSGNLNGTVEVVNVLGQTVKVQPVFNVTFKSFSVDYQPGIYIIRYKETDGYVQTQKVVIN